MAKKKKLTKAERKEARLRKGKQWLLTYTGSPKKMNKHYRERFHVDAVTAAKDLQELGVNYTQEQLDQIKQAEEQRLRQRRMEREAKEREQLAELYEDCDGRFAFIAGYTDGGAPYGVMWEEVGIDPGLPFEEKVKLYDIGAAASQQILSSSIQRIRNLLDRNHIGWFAAPFLNFRRSAGDWQASSMSAQIIL